MTTQSYNPFKLSGLPSAVAWTIEKALGLAPLAEKYEQRPSHASPHEFLDYTLKSLNCDVQLQGESLVNEIPSNGATIVFANHPYGGIEGVALTKALLEVRTDTKVLTNQMLSSIPELSPVFFGVDVLREKAAHRNTASVRSASNHLAEGGLLLVFPAGQVSAMSWGNFNVQDRQWNAMVGRLALKHQATCLPIYIHGTNPLYFQLGGLIHRRVRTALLPRQLSNKANRPIQMSVGSALLPRDYSKLTSAAAVTDMFRISTYFLAKTKRNLPHEIATPSTSIATEHANSQELATELAQLAEYKLLSKGDFDVYCAPFNKLNRLFDEIAIAREETFRAAGEGTGKEKDSDQFDPHYQHLFVWDRENSAIVGGYRLGETDAIVEKLGVNALYSRSLYKYDADYLEKLGPSLEVGRSFVAQRYQKHPSALDLLWKGIGHFVVKSPKYSVLFGCVSISSDHSELARAFISDAMMESFRAEQKFLENVKPIVPLRVRNKVWSSSMLGSIRDIGVFNKLVGQCDPGKSIPILLRHYLALNGRFVGFSVNKGFNDSLDGLILVNLRQMPNRYLNRYLGKEGSADYLQYWEHHEATV